MSKQQQRRAQILQEMAAIDRMAKGRLSAEFRDRIADGKTVRRGPYYKYQCWEGGRNVSRRVPAEEAQVLQEAVEGYHRFKELSEEYAELTIEMTRIQAKPSEGKKKPR